jgi:hypothetical protein
MSKLNAGEVEITLNGETRVLKPTLKAITGMSRYFGGLLKGVEQLRSGDIDAAAAVISFGLGLPDKESRKMPDKVAENGLTDGLTPALITFVGICSNGGKPLSDSEEEADAGGGQGKES